MKKMNKLLPIATICCAAGTIAPFAVSCSKANRFSAIKTPNTQDWEWCNKEQMLEKDALKTYFETNSVDTSVFLNDYKYGMHYASQEYSFLERGIDVNIVEKFDVSIDDIKIDQLTFKQETLYTLSYKTSFDISLLMHIDNEETGQILKFSARMNIHLDIDVENVPFYFDNNSDRTTNLNLFLSNMETKPILKELTNWHYNNFVSNDWIFYEYKTNTVIGSTTNKSNQEINNKNCVKIQTCLSSISTDLETMMFQWPSYYFNGCQMNDENNGGTLWN